MCEASSHIKKDGISASFSFPSSPSFSRHHPLFHLQGRGMTEREIQYEINKGEKKDRKKGIRNRQQWKKTVEY